MIYAVLPGTVAMGADFKNLIQTVSFGLRQNVCIWHETCGLARFAAKLIF
jgi:hypothetical protein